VAVALAAIVGTAGAAARGWIGSRGQAAPSPGAPPLPGVAAGPAWESDLQTGMIRAGAARKNLLVLFTSADADDAPLARAARDLAAARAASENHVLVRLDVGTYRASPASLTQAAIWTDRLAIDALPCLVWFDERGRPFFAVRDGRTTDVQAPMGLARDAKARRDSALNEAAALSGVDCAKRLDSALSAAGDDAVAGCYPDVMAEVVRLDGANAAGLRTKYGARVSARAAERAVQETVYPLIDAGDLRGAADHLAKLERDVAVPPRQRQMLIAFQAQLRAKLGAAAEAVALADRAIAVDPVSDEADKIRTLRTQIAP
jgi:hypothetical protein